MKILILSLTLLLGGCATMDLGQWPWSEKEYIYKDRIIKEDVIIEVEVPVASECEEPPEFEIIPTQIYSLTKDDKGDNEKIIKSLLISYLQSETQTKTCKTYLDAYRIK